MSDINQQYLYNSYINEKRAGVRDAMSKSVYMVKDKGQRVADMATMVGGGVAANAINSKMSESHNDKKQRDRELMDLKIEIASLKRKKHKLHLDDDDVDFTKPVIRPVTSNTPSPTMKMAGILSNIGSFIRDDIILAEDYKNLAKLKSDASVANRGINKARGEYAVMDIDLKATAKYIEDLENQAKKKGLKPDQVSKIQMEIAKQRRELAKSTVSWVSRGEDIEHLRADYTNNFFNPIQAQQQSIKTKGPVIDKGMKIVGGAGALTGAVQAGREIMSYPGWRRAAQAETLALNKALRAAQTAKTREALGLGAGVAAFGGLAGAGYAFNRMQAEAERKQQMQAQTPAMVEIPDATYENKVANWEGAKSVVSAAGKIGKEYLDTAGNFAKTHAPDKYKDTVGKVVDKVTSPTGAGVIAGGLALGAGMLAHKFIKGRGGGYNRLLQSASNKAHNFVHGNSGKPGFISRHKGPLMVGGAGIAAGMALRSGGNNQNPQQGYKYGNYIAQQYRNVSDSYTHPEGYVSLDEHPDYKEAGLSEMGIIADEVLAGGRTLRGVLRSRLAPSASEAAIQKAKHMLTGGVLGGATAIIGQGFATNALQNAAYQKQMMNSGYGQSYPQGPFGIDPNAMYY